MDWQIIALGVHLVGFALGVGGATISDVTFLNALREKRITSEHYKFLMNISRIVWIGLGLLILSGAVMFLLIYIERNSLPLLASAKWQAKLALVGIVFANGLYFKFKVFPSIRNIVNKELNLDSIGINLWKLAIPGTISIVSWYGILALSLLPRGFKFPLSYDVIIYCVLLLSGIIVSKTLLTRMLRNY